MQRRSGRHQTTGHAVTFRDRGLLDQLSSVRQKRVPARAVAAEFAAWKWKSVAVMVLSFRCPGEALVSVEGGDEGGDEQEFDQPVAGVDGRGDRWDAFPQDGSGEQDGGEGEP